MRSGCSPSSAPRGDRKGNSLHAADGIALAVEQMADAAQEIEVVGAVVAASAAALHRLDLAEAAFPEPQHVLRNVELLRDLTDGAECFRRFVHRRLALLGPGIALL